MIILNHQKKKKLRHRNIMSSGGDDEEKFTLEYMRNSKWKLLKYQVIMI